MTAVSGCQGTLLGRFDEPGLVEIGAGLAGCLQAPLVIYLQGDLGAGKTTLSRALIHALGHAGRVKSPTYGLLEHYELPEQDVLHLDLYRIGDPGELEFLGLEDLLGARTVLLVEWPERGKGRLPGPDLTISLEHSGDARFVYLSAHTESGRAVASALGKFASS
jgi:tRNA threonylcarbamoyladenosine biosynthesis protein TsaE